MHEDGDGDGDLVLPILYVFVAGVAAAAMAWTFSPGTSVFKGFMLWTSLVMAWAGALFVLDDTVRDIRATRRATAAHPGGYRPWPVHTGGSFPWAALFVTIAGLINYFVIGAVW